MKLVVLSDIHGNLPALKAVTEDIARWKPDIVVVAGDIVNRGPLPRECLEFALQRRERQGWILLRGNHEDYVINVAADPSSRLGPEEAVRTNVRWTAEQIGDPAPLIALPTVFELNGPHGEVRVVHASMRHNRDNILIDTPDHLLRQQIAPAPVVFCCGHTHRPLVRRLDATLVVNAGAVGLPFDDNPRASYAQLTWDKQGWQAEIIRLPYDYEQTARDYESSGFLSNSGPIAPLIFEEFRTAHPYLATWYRTYETDILAGIMTPKQSVEAFLAAKRHTV